MTPSPLPSEIYYRIIGHIADRTDLCSLSLCCIAFRDEAQGKLFRHVSKLGFIEHGKFLDAIIASPKRLAPMVKYCRMTEGTRVKSEGVLMRDAASTALLLMCNLTTLRIRDEALSYIDISALLHCSFQLITCEFGCLGGWDDLDPLLFTFLRTQSSLRHLTIHGNLAESTHKELFRDDPEWCPNIQSLSAKGSVICMFLAPHRHIQCLDWHYFSDTFGSSPLSKVKYLAFPVYNTAPNLSFLPRMTSLVLLDVSFFSYLEISKTLRFLKRTPQLQYLIVTVFLIYTIPEPSATEIARAAFKLCPTLRHVDISHTRGDSPTTFDRFYSPAISGEMECKTQQREDVYAWKAIP